MSYTLSRNLKLRLDDNLTANARYNLLRIDELAATLQTSSDGSQRFQSSANISFEPESPDVGGSGVGGTISFGSVDQPVDLVSVYGDFSLGGSLLLNGDELSIDLDGADRQLTLGANLSLSGAALSLILSSPLSITLPPDNGDAGQVLGTDGAGAWVWVDQEGGGNTNQETYTWSTADGSTKVVTHTLNSTDISVALVDLADNQIIEVDTITINSNSQITLTASEAPSSSWRIIIQA